ncbi:unnamed protein product [Nippostrongylus brasiliensis]|uniref:Rab3 GTPase-activating protein catalytic subunit n=1 Tax=Nippostrongylus brasiliensis TaxID=27835 RepID=A0A158QZF4_NIPBR|nr:unnamed protein product [Nippostrongylus brasiliensis]
MVVFGGLRENDGTELVVAGDVVGAAPPLPDEAAAAAAAGRLPAVVAALHCIVVLCLPASRRPSYFARLPYKERRNTSMDYFWSLLVAAAEWWQCWISEVLRNPQEDTEYFPIQGRKKTLKELHKEMMSFPSRYGWDCPLYKEDIQIRCHAGNVLRKQYIADASPLLPYRCCPAAAAERERCLSDSEAGPTFLNAELNYTEFIRCADNSSEKMIPFQDTSSDTFFHVGKIHVDKLQNVSSLNLNKEIGDLQNKPWLPLQQIKDELVNCLDLSFGSISNNEFKYDKGVYGWMNIMKFSCIHLNQNHILYGIVSTRTRFRLKQVFLRRQNTYWTTSGRSIITRDVQNIADVFAIRFSEYVLENVEEELDILREKTKGNLTQNESRQHTFSTMSVPMTSRVMVFPLKKLRPIVLNLSNELQDAAAEMLETCSNQTCSSTTNTTDTVKRKRDNYSFLMEKVFIDRTDDERTVIAYQTSRPYFVFDSHKRKTAHGVVEVKQEFSDDAAKLWTDLLEQQSSLALTMHCQSILRRSSLDVVKFC